jgi:hypothetical protein
MWENNPALINIYGTARSGSTLLDLILGNSPDAFSCGEVSAWFRPYRKHHFKIDCVCGKDPCPVWEKIKDGPESQFHAKVIRELRVRFVIDSSKDLCWIIDAQRWAAANKIRTVNLLLWKDPIDLAYSHWKRGQELRIWRHNFVRCYGRILKIGLPFVAVNYRDLVDTTQSKVLDICSAIGMPYFEGKERFWEKKHHHLFGSLGVRRQLQIGNGIIKAIKTFPPEFQAGVDSLQRQFAADIEVQHILRVLKQADVSSIATYSSPNQGFQLNNPLPLWYYLKRARQRFRRFFPQEFDPTVI